MRKATLAKILIFLLILVLWYGFLYHKNPIIKSEETYIVDGVCMDAYSEKAFLGKWAYKRYIVMDDGNTYRVLNFDSFGQKYLSDLKGKRISFVATDTVFSVFENTDKTALVSYSDNRQIGELLNEINSDSRTNRMIVFLLTFLIVTPSVFIREIMEFWQERYEKSIKKDREKKREARRRKSELVAENHKEQKVAPDKNTSAKKLKNRLKKQR